jgi:hypothetical protein
VYIRAARELAQPLETPNNPEGVVYTVCWQDGDFSSASMEDGPEPKGDSAGSEKGVEPQDEAPSVKASPESDSGLAPQDEAPDEEGGSPAGTYWGASEVPPPQQSVVSFEVLENETSLHLGEDGSVRGEGVLVYTSTEESKEKGNEGALVHKESEWKTVYQGGLEGSLGELTGEVTYHFESWGQGQRALRTIPPRLRSHMKSL